MTTNKNTPSNCSIELRCEATEICIRKLSEGNENNAESRTIEGYAAKFDRWSEPIGGWFKERIQRGAFDGTDMLWKEPTLARASGHSIREAIPTTSLTMTCMLTMFPHPLIKEYIERFGWTLHTLERTITASKTSRRRQEEWIVTNY